MALDKSGFLDTLKEGTLVQYVDDGVVLGETEKDVLNASKILNNRSRDGIKINHDKSKITNSKTDSLKFIGLTLFPDGTLKSTPKSGSISTLGNINKPNSINWKQLFPTPTKSTTLSINATRNASLIVTI